MRTIGLGWLTALAFGLLGLAAPAGQGSSAVVRFLTAVPQAAKAEPPVQVVRAGEVNGVVNPVLYPGSDLGAKINAVFAAGDHCAEVRIPPGKYTYSTSIRMTRACQSLYGAGSALTILEFTGGGDAILWQMQPYTIQKAGTLKGLTLKGPGAGAGNGIRSGTLVGATFEDIVINNFRGPNSNAILLENIRAATSPDGRDTMPGWTERTIMRDVHIGIPHLGNTTGLAFLVNGGTNSFGYTDIADVWLNVEKGQAGVKWGPGTYTYNSKLNFHANISALGSDAFQVQGIIRNSLFFLTGEAGCAKDLVHIGPQGEVQGQGFIAVNCASKLTHGQYVRTDLAGVQVDNPKWDALQLSPVYAPLVNGKGLLLVHNLDRNGETDFTNYYGPSPDLSAGGFHFYNTSASLQPPNADPGALLAKLDAQGNWMLRGHAAWGGGPAIPSSEDVALRAQLPLAGRTTAIGGVVKAGSCVSGTSHIPGARTGQVVVHPATVDGSLDSPLEVVSGAVTAANVVTVQRCAVAQVTLPAKTYNVRVLP
ncbi:MAG: hypothetical protein JST79_09325 [Acidobacteria bacterium]|nr:hypothetical protein [Acidobacteriota bacterium]